MDGPWMDHSYYGIHGYFDRRGSQGVHSWMVHGWSVTVVYPWMVHGWTTVTMASTTLSEGGRQCVHPWMVHGWSMDGQIKWAVKVAIHGWFMDGPWIYLVNPLVAIQNCKWYSDVYRWYWIVQCSTWHTWKSSCLLELWIQLPCLTSHFRVACKGDSTA